MCVIVINNASNKSRPALGKLFSQVAMTRVNLSNIGGQKRKVTIDKCLNRNPGDHCFVKITETGLEQCQE
jgi:hypothetical protein